jgi:lysophospholipase L1-like esterase
MFKKSLIVLITSSLLLGIMASSASARVFYSATDPNFRFIGRVWSDPSTVNMTWPGSTMKFRFTGKRVMLVLAEKNDSTYWVKIDNGDWKVFNDLKGETEIDLAGEILPAGEHELTLVKKTETWVRDRIKGIYLEDGEKLLPPPAPAKYRVEAIGDSITAGFKVHGVHNNANSDGRLSYGYQAAVMADAEPMITAISGIGVSHNLTKAADAGTMPKIYLRVDGGYPEKVMDFKNWEPDAITINLGTNDTSPYADPVFFKSHALAFLKQLRSIHPKAWILVLRPFKGAYEAEWKTVVAQQKKSGDTKVEFIDTKGWVDPATGYTDGTHPNPAGDKMAAEKLAPILKEYLEKK